MPAQRALVREVADRVRGRVLLRGVEIEVLALAERVQARRAHGRPGAAEARFLARLAELAAQAEREPAQRRVARDLCPGRGEVVGLVVELLRLHEVDLGAIPEHEFEGAVEVAGSPGASSSISVRRAPASTTTSVRQSADAREVGCDQAKGKPHVSRLPVRATPRPQVAEVLGDEAVARSSTRPRWRSTSSPCVSTASSSDESRRPRRARRRRGGR